jgi:hypothetical protein
MENQEFVLFFRTKRVLFFNKTAKWAKIHLILYEMEPKLYIRVGMEYTLNLSVRVKM